MTVVYGNPIECEQCEKLLGYAPYWRREYRCVECNGGDPEPEKYEDLGESEE